LDAKPITPGRTERGEASESEDVEHTRSDSANPAESYVPRCKTAGGIVRFLPLSGALLETVADT